MFSYTIINKKKTLSVNIYENHLIGVNFALFYKKQQINVSVFICDIKLNFGIFSILYIPS